MLGTQKLYFVIMTVQTLAELFIEIKIHLKKTFPQIIKSIDLYLRKHYYNKTDYWLS